MLRFCLQLKACNPVACSADSCPSPSQSPQSLRVLVLFTMSPTLFGKGGPSQAESYLRQSMGGARVTIAELRESVRHFYFHLGFGGIR